MAIARLTDAERDAALAELPGWTLRADGLATPALPLLVLVPTPAPAGGAGTAVWLVAHCDGRYVVTRDHATATPANRMGPLHDLTDVWAPNGEGWALCAEVSRAPT